MPICEYIYILSILVCVHIKAKAIKLREEGKHATLHECMYTRCFGMTSKTCNAKRKKACCLKHKLKINIVNPTTMAVS